MNKKCPQCGTIMKEIKDGPALNYECTKCGYAEATTNQTWGGWDATSYDVSVCKMSNPSNNEIKIISHLTGKNFIDSKSLLKTGEKVFNGKQNEIIEKLKELKRNNIKHEISPKFPIEY